MEQKTIGLTVIEAAQVLRTTPQLIRKLLKDGAIKGVFLGNRPGWRISESELERFLSSGYSVLDATDNTDDKEAE